MKSLKTLVLSAFIAIGCGSDPVAEEFYSSHNLYNCLINAEEELRNSIQKRFLNDHRYCEQFTKQYINRAEECYYENNIDGNTYRCSYQSIPENIDITDTEAANSCNVAVSSMGKELGNIRATCDVIAD